jgi:hypothetical protein
MCNEEGRLDCIYEEGRHMYVHVGADPECSACALARGEDATVNDFDLPTSWAEYAEYALTSR